MQRAFTLIEMMVTVSLIAIIAAYTVINLNFQREDRKVELAAREFYGTLSYARNLAVSGKVFQDENNDGAPDVPNGYGVNFALIAEGSDFYYKQQIYGDLYTGATPKLYDSTNENFGVAETIDIADISVSLYLDGILNGVLSSPQTIFFATPRGDITYYNVFSDVSTEIPPKTEIGFEFASIKDPTVKDRVVINRATGQIYVNENP